MILIEPDLDPGPNAAGANAVSRPSRKAVANLEETPSVRTLARFLAKAQAAIRLRGQVTALLTTDAALRDLNRRFRGKNKPTDVLSFPATPVQNARPAERVAGDLAISVPIARRQAAEQGHSLATELKVLMLHGLLHLAGYDHEADTGQMQRRERLLRASLGLPQGLIERSSAPKLRPTAGGKLRPIAASRREAGKIAPDEVRRETRRTQSGEGNPKSRKPRRGGGKPAPSTQKRGKNP